MSVLSEYSAGIVTSYLLPLIGESLDRLGRAKRLSQLDLTNAYHRIRQLLSTFHPGLQQDSRSAHLDAQDELIDRIIY